MVDLWPKYPWKKGSTGLERMGPPHGAPTPPRRNNRGVLSRFRKYSACLRHDARYRYFACHRSCARRRYSSPIDVSPSARELEHKEKRIKTDKMVSIRCDKIATPYTMKMKRDGVHYKVKRKEKGDGTVVASTTQGELTPCSIKHEKFVSSPYILRRIVEIAT
jgi:hypothetical protein